MRIPLTPKQAKLLNLIETGDKTRILYGGAKGGGKSHVADELAFFLCMKYHVKAMIVRKYSNDVLINHIYPFFSRHPELRNSFNKSEKILFHPYTGELLIKFSYAETEEDVEQIAQGPEYQLVFVDEASQFTEAQLKYFATCLRDPQKRLPSKPKLIYLGNPGNVGHAYLKRAFIDKVYQGNEKAQNYLFIPAFLWDNVFWCKEVLEGEGYTIDDYYYKWTEEQRKQFAIENSDYAENLSGLPEQLKLALMEGDWDVFGGNFFKGFNAAEEVIKPFPIPDAWPLVGCLDPGFSSPLSYSLVTKDFSGNVITVASYYAIDKIPNHAVAIRDWLMSEHSPIYPYLKGRKPDYTVSGRDAFSRLDANALQPSEETIEAIFNNYGIPLIKGNDVAHSRVKNWWLWKGLIPNRYFIFEGLGNEVGVSQLLAMESDRKNPEDIKGLGNDPNVEDHWLDSNKLGIAALITPKEEKPAEPIWGRGEERITERKVMNKQLSDKQLRF